MPTKPFWLWFQWVIAIFFIFGGTSACVDSAPLEPVAAEIPVDTNLGEGKPSPSGPDAKPDRSSERPMSEKKPDADPWHAEAITEATVQAFPHLSSFLGHVLLGRPSHHVVLAGLPLQANASEWQPLILSTFRLDPSRLDRKKSDAPIYIADSSLSDISVQATDAQRDMLRPVDLEFEVDPNHSAKVSYRWRTQSEALRVELTASPGKLELRFYKDGARTRFEVAKPLRLRGYLDSQVVTESRDFGGLRGSLGLLRYDHQFATGILSYRPFIAKDRLGEMVLLPEADRSDSKAPLIEGYDFLFGERLPSYIFEDYAIAICQYGDRSPNNSGKAEINVERTRTCVDKLPRGTVEFQVQAGDVGKGTYPYPLFLYGARKLPELFIPLHHKVTVPLPAGHTYRFSADRAAGSWASAAPLAMSAGMMKSVELPARAQGKVHIDIGANEGAAVVVIGRLLLPQGDSGLVQHEDTSDVFRLHSHILMVKKWPLTLDLLAGSYEIKLMRGQDGSFCSLRADVVAGQTERMRCPRALPAQEDDDKLGWLAADLATRVGSDVGPLKWVLGVEWLARTVETQQIIAPGQQEPVPSSSTDASIVPTLVAMSPDLGIDVHAILVSTHAAVAWRTQQAGNHQGLLDEQAEETAGQNLQTFVRLMRKTSPEVFIELGCPAGHLSYATYERIVGALQPDGLRIYGCAVGVRQDELLAWVAKLMKSKNQRYLMTTASSLGLLESDVHFPRLMLLGRQNSAGYQASELIAAMSRGAYTLSSGATLVIESAKMENTPSRQITLETDLRLLASARVWQLIIYSENGEIFRKPLYDSDAQVQKIPVSFTLPPGTKWLRAELRGASQQAVTRLLFERGDGMHLASTNFISLDSLLSPF